MSAQQPLPYQSLAAFAHKQKRKTNKAPPCPAVSCCLYRIGKRGGPLTWDDHVLMMQNVHAVLTTGKQARHIMGCSGKDLPVPKIAQLEEVVRVMPMFNGYPSPALLAAVADQTRFGRTRTSDAYTKLQFASYCLQTMGVSGEIIRVTPQPRTQRKVVAKQRVARGPNPEDKPQFIRRKLKRGRAMKAKSWRKTD